MIANEMALLADLEAAEAILAAITNEHRPAETLVRTSRENGANAAEVTEYYQDCCTACRDAKGRPYPYPCRTMQIIEGKL